MSKAVITMIVLIEDLHNAMNSTKGVYSVRYSFRDYDTSQLNRQDLLKIGIVWDYYKNQFGTIMGFEAMMKPVQDVCNMIDKYQAMGEKERDMFLYELQRLEMNDE